MLGSPLMTYGPTLVGRALDRPGEGADARQIVELLREVLRCLPGTTRRPAGSPNPLTLSPL